METPPVERRLVAILAADVEGYSRLMHGDEETTMATLSARRALVDQLIGRHRGRIANTAGDSVLAEFVSVLDAVHCAVEIQGELQKANEGEPEERQMRFRIGVNVGDVMAKEGDIFGDGVNVTARLEGLVRGGEICVSRGVRDHLRHRGGFLFEDLGEQLVKNIAHPIRAFRLRIGEGSPEQQAPASDEETPNRPIGLLPRRRCLNCRPTMRSPWSWHFGRASRMAVPPSSNPISSSIRRVPSPRSPKHDLRQRRFRRRPRRRPPRKSPLTLSTLPSGIPSRTATGAKSWKPTSSNIPMAISPGSHARASFRQIPS